MSTSPARKAMTPRTLWWFFAITFVQCWGIAGAFVAFQDQLAPIFGPMGYTNPFFILAAWAPAFAGVGLVLRHYGLNGLGSFLRRFTLWRMPAPWWTFLLLGIPAIFYAGATLKGTFPAPFPFTPWYAAIPALATALVIGPIEELGWRGLALPLLQRRFSPFVASLILGAIWAVWHMPAFFLSGTPQSSWSFGGFFVGVMAITIILTAMFNSARGSLLVAFFCHFMMNNPIWPDAQPWDFVLFAVAAAVVVFLNRKSMFVRGSGVSDVLAPDTGSTSRRESTVVADVRQPSSTLYDESIRPLRPTALNIR